MTGVGGLCHSTVCVYVVYRVCNYEKFDGRRDSRLVTVHGTYFSALFLKRTTMPSQFISADALDDEDQFELLPDAKRRLPSGSDASDLEDFSTKKPRTKKQKKGRLDGVHTDRTENEKGGIDSSPEGAMANFQSASSKPAISTGSNPKLPSTSNKKDRPIPQTASKDATRAKKKKDKKGKGKAKADTKVLAPLAEVCRFQTSLLIVNNCLMIYLGVSSGRWNSPQARRLLSDFNPRICNSAIFQTVKKGPCPNYPILNFNLCAFMNHGFKICPTNLIGLSWVHG